MLTPLLEDFRQILNTSRFKLVKKTDLLTTKPCQQCSLAERKPGKECVAMGSTASENTEAQTTQHFPFLPLDERVSLLKRSLQSRPPVPAASAPVRAPTRPCNDSRNALPSIV